MGAFSLYLAFGVSFAPSVLPVARTGYFLIVFRGVNFALLAFFASIYNKYNNSNSDQELARAFVQGAKTLRAFITYT